MRSLSDEEETVSSDVRRGSTSAQPAYMIALRESCSEWLKMLPLVSDTCSQLIEFILTTRFYRIYRLLAILLRKVHSPDSLKENHN